MKNRPTTTSKADREQLIKSARIANAIPEETEFWKEVGERLDLYQKAKVDRVVPRTLK